MLHAYHSCIFKLHPFCNNTLWHHKCYSSTLQHTSAWFLVRSPSESLSINSCFLYHVGFTKDVLQRIHIVDMTSSRIDLAPSCLLCPPLMFVKSLNFKSADPCRQQKLANKISGRLATICETKGIWHCERTRAESTTWSTLTLTLPTDSLWHRRCAKLWVQYTL